MTLSFETAASGLVIFIFFLFWLLVFALFYHFARFGIGLLPKRLAALFLTGSVILFGVMITLYLNYV